MKDRLPDEVDTNARVRWRHNGTDIATRRRVNLIDGDNVTITVTDSPSTEAVDVTIAATSGGDTLWELDGSDDLHPLADPTTFTVRTYEDITFDSGSGESSLILNDSGQMTLFGNEYVHIEAQGGNFIDVGVTDIVLQSFDGVSDLDLDGTNGDLNSILARDFNMSANRDVNLSAGSHSHGATLAGDVNINAANGDAPSSGDVNVVSGRDMNLTLVRYLRITGLPTANPGGTGRVWNDSGTLKIT